MQTNKNDKVLSINNSKQKRAESKKINKNKMERRERIKSIKEL